jgi:hypothetical protein
VGEDVVGVAAGAEVVVLGAGALGFGADTGLAGLWWRPGDLTVVWVCVDRRVVPFLLVEVRVVVRVVVVVPSADLLV